MSTEDNTDDAAASYVRIDVREARRWTREACRRLDVLDEADVPPEVAGRIQADITTRLAEYLNVIGIARTAVARERGER